MDIRARVLDIASIYMAQLGLKYNFAGQQRSAVRTWAVRIAAVLGGLVGLVLLLSLWLPDGPDSDAQAQQQQNRQQQTIPIRPAQPAQGQQPAQPAGPTVRNFDDWALVCDKPQGATRDVCFVYQQIQVNNTNQRLLLTRAGQASTEGVSMLAFTLPLGSRLQSGMAMKVDDNPQIQAAFQVCASDGCLAAHPLDSDLLQQMSNGKQAVVAIIDHGNGQQINITLSLKGFGAAYKAIPNAPALAARPTAAAPAAQAQQPARAAAPGANQPAARQPAQPGQAPQLQPPGTQRR